eukprot:2443909-Amphidinium_carterae.1
MGHLVDTFLVYSVGLSSLAQTASAAPGPVAVAANDDVPAITLPVSAKLRRQLWKALNTMVRAKRLRMMQCVHGQK